MRKILFIVVLFMGAAFVYLSFGELESIVQTLQRGNLWFVLLALSIQGAWFFVSGFTYRSLYQLLGAEGSAQKFALLSAAANFVNTVAPSAGMSGMAVFIAHAHRNGQSPGKATVVSMLYLLLDYIAFLCVLTLGLIVLIRRNDLTPAEIGASVVMFAIATALAFLLYLGSRSAETLGNVLAWMIRLINRIARPFIHREYLSETRAHEFARDMAEDLKSLPEEPNSLIKPMLFAFLNKTLMLGILAVTFLSFQVPFTAGTIIGGFAISYLFLVVSPTPSGIGIVEGIMPLALTSLRVEWSQAVIITLAYRGVTFWVPVGVGAIAFRVLNRNTK